MTKSSKVPAKKSFAKAVKNSKESSKAKVKTKAKTKKASVTEVLLDTLVKIAAPKKPPKLFVETKKAIKGIDPKVMQLIEKKFSNPEFGEAQKTILLNDMGFIDYLQDVTECSEFYANPCHLTSTFFALNLGTLKSKMLGCQPEYREHLKNLITVGDSISGDRSKLCESMLEKGVMAFDLLPLAFPAGTKIVMENSNGDLVGGVVESARIFYGFTGPYLGVSYKNLIWTGSGFHMVEKMAYVGVFEGTKPVSELSIRLPTEQEKASLIERGHLYSELAVKATHMTYSGYMTYKAGWFERDLESSGRIMVDINAYHKMNDEYMRAREDQEIRNVNDDLLYTCPAMIEGFSLVKKRWGRFRLLGLAPVEYNRASFDKLVLEQDMKNQLVSMIDKQGSLYTDIISGKGGGIITLLAGPPGLGKTATAETVAEYMERPLYSVSIGELGVNPNELETNLQNVLNLATAWNAIILLDEGDIYLSKRRDGDILRNAMTGVFLRQLEYHNGVVFVTTNRDADLDPAVLSRMSLLIRYKKFTPVTRAQVWSSILTDAGLSSIDPNRWAKRDINGRTIKNVIRVAMAMGSGKTPEPSVVATNIEKVLGQYDVFYKESKQPDAE